jgi:peptidoglycan/xylan/chitin deacetylase (PgdA/CDA1 family)
MRVSVTLSFCLALAGSVGVVQAASCPGNPSAIGTSRTITIGQTDLPRIGSMQYGEGGVLPLKNHEVVLTFDDGPIAPYTPQVLDILARDCVKATFFLVGNQASNAPDLVRRIYNDGHTIGTHSQNHPLTFDRMAQPRIDREVGDGIASAATALGDAKAVSPYFRIPGLLRSKAVEDYLASKSLAVWSADVVADDWYRRVTAKDIVRKAMHRLDEKGRGVLLLHDIHPATVMALPTLLKELKASGYRIVHVIAPGNRPATLPDRVAQPGKDKQGWPRVARTGEPEQTGSVTKTRKSALRRARERIAAEVAKKKQKAQTASGWLLFQR